MLLSPKLTVDIFYITVTLIVISNVFRLLNAVYKPFFIDLKTKSLILFLLLLIGLRPITGIGIGQYFGDTVNYYSSFKMQQDGVELKTNDVGFQIITDLFVNYFNAESFFFFLTLLYLFPIYWALKRLKVNDVYLVMVAVVSSFLFFSNGVNGIRAGIGSSLALLAITYYQQKWKSLLLFAFSISIHQSMLLPFLAFFISYFYKNVRGLIGLWLLSIVASISFGSFWENFFSKISFLDDRFSTYLLNDEYQDAFRYTGFRWDFLLYSASAVFMGWWFIVKKKFNDELYYKLFVNYVIANSFWILVIRSSFSNRFAALSWFLIPVLLTYPFLKTYLTPAHQRFLAIILLGNFAFTLIMKYVL